jgi:prepilin peptidase CpaA
LQTTISLAGIALFIVAAYGDVKTFRIPNMLVGGVALLGVVRLLVIGDPTAALCTVGASLVVFVVGFLLFWPGFCGGGDTKLLTAAALLIGYRDLYSFLLIMGICGAMLSVAVLFMRSSLPLWLGPSLAIRLSKVRSVPYGVAIAAGGITTLLSQSSLSSFLR